MGLFTLKLLDADLSSGILEKVKTDSIDYESVGDIGKYPDLIGIDSTGDLVIVELKHGGLFDMAADIWTEGSKPASAGGDEIDRVY
ncbi:MAG: hypothetical protein PHU36_04515 [Syntrophomonadaceae bacterium]|nr:hypothetical protein [Syntrophomonadaceae bacterium]